MRTLLLLSLALRPAPQVPAPALASPSPRAAPYALPTQPLLAFSPLALVREGLQLLPATRVAVLFQAPPGQRIEQVRSIEVPLANRAVTAGRLRVRVVAPGPAGQPSELDLLPPVEFTAVQLTVAPGHVLPVLTPGLRLPPPAGLFVLLEAECSRPGQAVRGVRVAAGSAGGSQLLAEVQDNPADPGSLRGVPLSAFPELLTAAGAGPARTWTRGAFAGWRSLTPPSLPGSLNCALSLRVELR